MSCGDQYRGFVVTADGYTLDNPYGNLAVPSDYSGWRTEAQRVHSEMLAHYGVLSAMGEKSEAAKAAWTSFFSDVQSLTARLFTLGDAWMTGNEVIEGIGRATALVLDELCMMERIDGEIARLGGTPKPIPGSIKPSPPPASPKDAMGLVFKLGAVALGAYVVVNLLKK